MKKFNIEICEDMCSVCACKEYAGFIPNRCKECTYDEYCIVFEDVYDCKPYEFLDFEFDKEMVKRLNEVIEQ